MPYSMTGYGRSIITSDGRELTLELKSVNHRFLDLAFRMPRSFAFLESEMRAQLGEKLARGHVDVFVSYKNLREDSRSVRLDTALLNGYLNALRTASAATGLADDLRLSHVMRMADVLVTDEADEDENALRELVKRGLDEAIAGLNRMRATEGEALKRDILLKLDEIEAMTRAVDEREPIWLADYQAKLRARVQELLQSAPDETRLAQEIALLADRSAVDEETVRLRSHITQLRELLSQDAPSGRKMDFIVQEMNREANTIGSKSSDLALTQLVVSIKSEVEKIREQVQNIE